MTEGRIPPFSLESEQATLGAIMIDPDGVAKLEIGLSGEDFYEPRHRIIFDSIESLYESSRPVDLLTVAEELKTKDKLDAAGGMGYLMDLTTATPTSANLNYYAGIVAQKSILRNIIRVGEEIASLGYMTDLEASAALDEAEKKIYHISLKKERLDSRPSESFWGLCLSSLRRYTRRVLELLGFAQGTTTSTS